MADSVGRLDGLREIIAPMAPVQADYSIWLMACLASGGFFLLIYFYIRYRRQPMSKARRLFRQLKRHSESWSAAHCGDCLNNILRYCQLAAQANAFNENSLLQQSWQQLLDDCNCLRFSGRQHQPETLQRVMEQTRTLLWPSA